VGGRAPRNRIGNMNQGPSSEREEKRAGRTIKNAKNRRWESRCRKKSHGKRGPFHDDHLVT